MGRGVLTDRFEDALVYAIRAHDGQTRKGTSAPYACHLLAVCGLVIEDGGDEDEAIAALLHDAVEDQGGLERLADIRERFGERVADIVERCTDTHEDPKPPWLERKRAYLEHLARQEDPGTLRVSIADKVHNARAIVRDRMSAPDPAGFWARFNAGPRCQLWYYGRLVQTYRAAPFETPMLRDLEQAVAELESLEGGPSDDCPDLKR